MATKKTPKRVAEVPSLLTAAERRRMVGTSLADIRTILRWEAGGPLRPLTKQALDAAARKLGLPIPPAKKEAGS
jgi:hypothetical protein